MACERHGDYNATRVVLKVKKSNLPNAYLQPSTGIKGLQIHQQNNSNASNTLSHDIRIDTDHARFSSDLRRLVHRLGIDAFRLLPFSFDLLGDELLVAF